MNLKIKKVVYIFLGFLFLGLGAVGALLPVLPTTPFLLLASFFFTKGSDKFNKWFKSTKLYKNHLENFIQNRSMELKVKVRLLCLSSSMLLLSAYLVDITLFRVFIIFLMIYKYYYFIFKIKTIKFVKEGVTT